MALGNPKIGFGYVFKRMWPVLTVYPLYHIGSYLDYLWGSRMTKFRDRSALYGGMKGPDEEPSWYC